MNENEKQVINFKAFRPTSNNSSNNNKHEIAIHGESVDLMGAAAAR